MSNNQEKIDKIKRLIDEARKAHDDDTAKALGETLFELTGVKEPEFAAEESSGNPKLDKLRKHLVAAISARDDECEANLREMIAEIEKEAGPGIPEVTVELAEEVELEDSIENPFAEREDEDVVSEAELTPFVAEDYAVEEELLEPEEEDVLIEDLMKDVLRPTQISALQKAGIATESDAFEYIYADGGDAMSALLSIKGISDKSANIILDTLSYGD